MTNNEKTKIIYLLQVMQDAITHMASDLNTYDLDCYYCAHFPEGGDGLCPMYSDDNEGGWCHFKWRLADEVEEAIEKLREDIKRPIVTLQ